MTKRTSLDWVWPIIGCVVLSSPVTAAQPTTAPDANLGNALGRTPNETRGQRIYEQQCRQCHQADGGGSAAQKVPALAGQQYEYLVKQIVDFLDAARLNNTMHQQLARGGLNNATSIADVVGYVANLPRNPAPQQGPGTAVAQGRAIYESQCASCHGPTAEGSGALWVPNLRGQHYSYLVEQMQRMVRAQRTNISEDLHRVFTGYSNEELQAAADYLSRWNP